MIRSDASGQILQCSRCGTLWGVSRQTRTNPERMAIVRQSMEAKHKACGRAFQYVAEQTLKERVWERVKREIRAVAL